MCLYPTLIKNRKYISNKKNGGNIPPIKDERTRYVPIGCQNCIECRKQKAREWQVRLLEDIKDNKNGKFITLTFNNNSIKELKEYVYEHIDEKIDTLRNQPKYNDKTRQKINKLHNEKVGYLLDNQIAKTAVRLFLERFRKKYGKSLRHWLVTELGHNGTENIHLHGIIWTDLNLNTIEEIWKYGFMWKGKNINGKLINYVNETTVSYITKYVNKTDIIHKTYKSRILTSPGIGANYTEKIYGDHEKNKFKGELTKETYTTRTGHKMALPIYWRNKIYSEEQKETLWLQKLNKQIRYVCGEKIDISKDDTEYIKTREYYRELNQKLGYGTDQKDYEQEQYERERRILMQKTRLHLKTKKGVGQHTPE